MTGNGTDYERLTASLEAISRRILNSVPTPARVYEAKELFTRRASLLLGPRGIGKTTYLLRNSKNKNAFYLSLDNPLLASVNFYDYADFLFQSGYDLLIFDEVHFQNNWAATLKALYDAHPRKKIIATDSSSLLLRKGLSDLSRRFVIERISYLPFREYLYLRHGELLPPLSFENLISDRMVQVGDALLKSKINIQKEFKLYLAAGTRPFFLEGDYKGKLINTIDKIIYSDIPYFLPEVKERHLHLMKNVVGFLATSPIPNLNIDSLGKTWAVGKSTIYNLLEVMSQSGIIRVIPEAGRKGTTKGKKIFFAEPNLYSAYEGNLGNVRECFVSMAFDGVGKKIFCPKDDSHGDFIVDDFLFEVGGQKKKFKAANFVIRDNIDRATKGIIPMWLLGFLE